MKTYLVDTKIEIGRLYKIKAKSEKEAIEIIKRNWNFENCIDESHFKIESNAMEMEE